MRITVMQKSIEGDLILLKTPYINKLDEVFTNYKNDFRSVIIGQGKEKVTKKKLSYLSVPPGAGKTEWAKNYIYKNSNKKKHKIIYSAPTRELLNQTYDRIMELNPNSEIHLVHSGKESVRRFSDRTPFGAKIAVRINQHLESMQEGDCLLITHEALLNLDHTQLSDFYLIFDEASEWEVFEHLVSFKKDSAKFLNEVLHYEAFPKNPQDNVQLSVISRTMESELFHPFYRLHINKNSIKKVNDFLKTPELANPNIVNVLRKIKDDTFSMYARSMTVTQDKKEFQFSFMGFSSPKYFFNYFKKVVLLAAFFEQSLLYNFLCKHYKLKKLHDYDMELAEKDILRGYKNLEIVSIFDIDKTLSKNLLNTNIYVEPKYKIYLDEIVHDCFCTADEADLTFNKEFVAKQITELLLKVPKEKSIEDLNAKTNFLKKVKSVLMSERVTYERLRRARKYITSAAEYLQSLIHADLDARKKAGFKVKGDVLFLSNIGLEFHKTSDNLLSFESLVNVFDEYEWLSSKSHGINKYRNHNLLINLAAFNPTSLKTQFYHFLFGQDFSPVDLHTYIVMQGITRTRIRNPDNKGKVIVYVFSTAEARQIQKLAPRCTITSLNANTKSLMKISIKKLSSGSSACFVESLNRYVPEIKKLKVTNRVEAQKTSSKFSNTKYRQDAEYKKLESKISYVRQQLRNCTADKKAKLESKKEKLSAKLKERRKLLKDSHKKPI